MVRGLNNSTEDDLHWMEEFAKDFRRRFLTLLSFKFREFGSVTSLSVLEAPNAGVKKLDEDKSKELRSAELSILLAPFDLKRLESYANNMLDYHVVLDLLPMITSLFFEKRLGDEVRLNAVQSSILLALGLQRKLIEEVETELQLPVAQALTLFVKVVRKISKLLVDIQKAAIRASIPEVAVAPTSRVVGERNAKTDWTPIGTSLDEELTQAGNGATNALREKQREMIDSLDLNKVSLT